MNNILMLKDISEMIDLSSKEVATRSERISEDMKVVEGTSSNVFEKHRLIIIYPYSRRIFKIF